MLLHIKQFIRCDCKSFKLTPLVEVVLPLLIDLVLEVLAALADACTILFEHLQLVLLIADSIKGLEVDETRVAALGRSILRGASPGGVEAPT